MDLFRFAIVGSGPSGIAAARVLEKHGACLVDVGELPRSEFPYATLREALANGDCSALLGKHFEVLSNLRIPNRVSPKLRAECFRHIADGEPFTVYDDAGEVIYNDAGSYAAGGMSSAWGGMLLRYSDADLKSAGNWPISAESLVPYYADLEKHIGISGSCDDMSDYGGGGGEYRAYAASSSSGSGGAVFVEPL